MEVENESKMAGENNKHVIRMYSDKFGCIRLAPFSTFLLSIDCSLHSTMSLGVARVKFEPESSSSHESSSSQVKFSFFFSSFVFNCCVKIMYQRYGDSKILLFFWFVYFSLPITTVYSRINLVRSCFSKK